MVRKLSAIAASAAAALAIASGSAAASASAAPQSAHAVSVQFYVVGVASNLTITFRGRTAHYDSFADGRLMQARYGDHTFRGRATYSAGGWINCSMTVVLSNGRKRQLATASTTGGVCALHATPENASGTKWSAG